MPRWPKETDIEDPSQPSQTMQKWLQPTKKESQSLPDNLQLMPHPRDLVLRVWPRPKEQLAPLSQKAQQEILSEKALEAFYVAAMKSAGGPEELVHALMLHPDNHDPGKDKRWLRVAAALNDQKYVGMPFAKICATFHIRPQELIPYFLDYKRSLGLFEIAESTPKVAKQLSRDAQHRTRYCLECDGYGFIWRVERDDRGEAVKEGKRTKKIKVPCLECDGNGKVERGADTEAREKVLEISGLISKEDKRSVVINQNFGGALEDTVTDVGRLLSGN